jgi:hypothetical protein
MSAPRPSRTRLLSAVRFLAAVGAVLMASPGSARAAVFYDATLDLGLKDDARIFLSVTNDYFAPPSAVAVDLVRRCPSPVDDYPVVLLFARASRRPPQEILKMRLDYLSWSDIMFQLRIPPSILFAGLDHDPGPPYGRAWGRWKKLRRGERFEIRDRDVVEFAKLQVASGYHHLSPYTVVRERTRGVSVEEFVAEKNRGRYKGDRSGQGQPRGQRSDKSKGHDKPGGHGHPHDKP